MMDMKLTRQIEETVPMVNRMLVTGHRYKHFRNAIPNISEAAAIIQAYIPCIGSVSKGKYAGRPSDVANLFTSLALPSTTLSQTGVNR